MSFWNCPPVCQRMSYWWTRVPFHSSLLLLDLVIALSMNKGTRIIIAIIGLVQCRWWHLEPKQIELVMATLVCTWLTCTTILRHLKAECSACQEALWFHLVSVFWIGWIPVGACCSDVGRQGGRDGEKPKVISQQSKPVFFKGFSFLTVKRKHHFNTSFPKSPSKRREHRKSFSKGGQELFGFVIILGESCCGSRPWPLVFCGRYILEVSALREECSDRPDTSAGGLGNSGWEAATWHRNQRWFDEGQNPETPWSELEKGDRS